MEKEFEKLIGNITPSKEYVDIFKDVVLKAWEEDHSDFEKRYRLAKEKVESLEFEKSETIRMKRRGEITLEEYEIEIAKLRNEIIVAQLVENENKIYKNKLEVLLTQAELFLTNIEPLRLLTYSLF